MKLYKEILGILFRVIVVMSIFDGNQVKSDDDSSSVNYELTLKDFEAMIPNDKINLNLDKVKMKRVNRTHPHSLFGEMELFKSFGNEVTIIAEFFKMQGYEYRPTPYKLKSKLCDYIKSEHIFYPEFLEDTDLPPQDVCPIPKGVYHFNGHSPAVDKIPHIFETGEYMVIMKLQKFNCVSSNFYSNISLGSI
jgi:hypothetical protein